MDQVLQLARKPGRIKKSKFAAQAPDLQSESSRDSPEVNQAQQRPSAKDKGADNLQKLRQPTRGKTNIAPKNQKDIRKRK